MSTSERPIEQALIDEKLRILRLLRALDRAGVDPEEEAGLRVPLIRLSEIDALLTSILEFVEREEKQAASNPALGQQIHALLPAAEGLRGEVLDAVPKRQQEAVRRASAEVVASESEILLELDGFRRDAARAGKNEEEEEEEGRLLSNAELEALAEEAWTGDAPLARFKPDRRVTAHEAKPLPDSESPLRPWFDRLPRPWREAMALVHDLPKKGKGALAQRLADRVSDPAWMRCFLAERLGVGEREMLARFLACRAVNLDDDADDDTKVEEILFVSWDWARYYPASVGGKLRAAGLVHVGTQEGVKLAVVPPPLLVMIGDLLEEVDPASAGLPERAVRRARAEALKDAPFEDEELARWKQPDQALTERIEQWMVDSVGRMQAAIDDVYQGGERVIYSEEEAGAMFHYAFFDWREAAERPTLAEQVLAEATFTSDEERALALATAEACPVLYRVEDLDRDLEVTFLPIFPAGEPVVVTDRGLSLTLESGMVIALRVYPAGPFLFARICGRQLNADRGKVALRAMRREFRAFVREGGFDDAEHFLRECPWVFLRVLREHWR